MTTRVVTSTSTSTATTTNVTSTATATATATISRNGTTTIRSKSSPSFTNTYLVCDDPDNHSPFVNPTVASSKEDVVSKTKTDDEHDRQPVLSSSSSSSSLSSSFSSYLYSSSSFGGKDYKWPSRSSTPSWILQPIVFFDTVFVSWLLMYVLNAYHEKVPLSTKRQITFTAWKWYVWIHKLVVCQWMGFYNNSSFYKTSNGNLEKDDKKRDVNYNNNNTTSDEFKALSTLLYPTQFFPVSIPRMRFAISQLNAVSLNEIPSKENIERVEWDCCDVHNNDNNEKKADNDNDNDSNTFVVPESQRDHQTVQGLFVRNSNNNNNNREKENIDSTTTTAQNKNKKTTKVIKKVLFWLYGGAYLAGDAEGNLSLANEFITDCDADSVFIPSYRLAPEATIDDVFWDICLSYWYLLQRLQKQEQQKQPQQQQEFEIVFVGVSSGGALALRLLQFIRDRSATSTDKKLPLMPSFLEPLVDEIVAATAKESSSTARIRVAGAVLFGPYVDYRDPQPSNGSFLQNAKYDWIVNEAVQYYGLPYLNGFIPPTGDDLLLSSSSSSSSKDTTTGTTGTTIKKKNSNNNTNGRIQYSPLSHEMNDLPPLCLIASEHEACYDMTIAIVNKARRRAAKTKTNTNTSSTRSGGSGADITIGVWKHMCHVFSVMQAFLPEGKASIEFAKEWIRTKTTTEDRGRTLKPF